MIGKKLSPVLEEMEATLWEYEAFNGAKQELPTCRTCKHRQRWELNDHSTKIVQSCALQKSRRTGNGLKRIKVTNPACRLYEKE